MTLNLKAVLYFGMSVFTSRKCVTQQKIRNLIVCLCYLAGHVARMGEEGWVYRVLVGKPEGKRPLGSPRRRCVDNIRMDLQEVGCGYMDWIGLAQDRDRGWNLVSAVVNLWFQ